MKAWIPILGQNYKKIDLKNPISMLQTLLILESWNGTVKRVSDLFATLSDEQLLRTVAPNRNRGIYLLGHLTAVHDAMLPLLGFGEALFPELTDPFLKNPDNVNEQPFTVAELRHKWIAVNDELKKQFSSLSPEQWLQKHTAVSEEDFAKQPHRNRLNVLLSRTNHLSYHQGQVALLQDSKKE